MTYALYLDDIRNPKNPKDWVIARSSRDAIQVIVEKGIPNYMSLDHDLGEEDTTMVFLKAFTAIYPEGPIPLFSVHSANPIGKQNIEAYLDSWKRSLEM